jgi:ATP-dependent protease ClpP protease subunit
MLGRKLLTGAVLLALATSAAGQQAKLNRSEPAIASTIAIKTLRIEDETHPLSRVTESRTVEGVARPAEVWASEDKRTIYLVGEIVGDTLAKFTAVAKANPEARTLYLASPGGRVWEGYMIGSLVREKGLDTWVEYDCASSCTQIFAAGKARLFGQQARLGFHQTYRENWRTGDLEGSEYKDEADLAARLADEAKLQAMPRGDKYMVRALRWAKVPDAFLVKVLRTKPEDSWSPPAEELLKAGMVTRVIGHEPGLSVPEGILDRAKLAEDLLKQRFWQVLRAKQPEKFEESVGDIWRESNSGASRDASEADLLISLFVGLRTTAARVPDPLLARLVTALAADAMRERFNGYPTCTGTSFERAAMNARGMRISLTKLGDLYAEVLESPTPVAAMTSARAIDIFAAETDRLVKADPDYSVGGESSRDYCRLTYVTDEAVNRLEPKHRLRVARAWLSV